MEANTRLTCLPIIFQGSSLYKQNSQATKARPRAGKQEDVLRFGVVRSSRNDEKDPEVLLQLFGNYKASVSMLSDEDFCKNDVASSFRSNVKSILLNMGFSQALVDKFIEEKGKDNVELLVDTLPSFEGSKKGKKKAKKGKKQLHHDEGEVERPHVGAQGDMLWVGMEAEGNGFQVGVGQLQGEEVVEVEDQQLPQLQVVESESARARVLAGMPRNCGDG